jgi:hypothetical protein
MQIALGRRRVLEIRIDFAVRERVENACQSVRGTVDRCVRRQGAAGRWEQDKLASSMLSSWDEMFWKE